MKRNKQFDELVARIPKETFEKGFFELLIGNPVVFDDNGNLVRFCDIPPAQRIEYIEYRDFTFEEFKKAFEDLSSYEQRK